MITERCCVPRTTSESLVSPSFLFEGPETHVESPFMSHLSAVVFYAQRKQLLGRMLLQYYTDKQARLTKHDEEFVEKERMLAFVADSEKPDSVDYCTFQDLAPGEEDDIPQPVAIDFELDTIGECWPARLSVDAGSKPEA